MSVTAFHSSEEISSRPFHRRSHKVWIYRASTRSSAVPTPTRWLPFFHNRRTTGFWHLEKRVWVVRIVTNLFEIVMLAGHADNFLRIRRAGIGARANAQENILELVHAGIGEEEGFIPMPESPARWGRSGSPRAAKKSRNDWRISLEVMFAGKTRECSGNVQQISRHHNVIPRESVESRPRANSVQSQDLDAAFAGMTESPIYGPFSIPLRTPYPTRSVCFGMKKLVVVFLCFFASNAFASFWRIAGGRPWKNRRLR